MSRTPLVLTLVASFVLLVGGYALYRAGMQAGHAMSPGPTAAGEQPAQKPGDIDPATGKRVLYWQDPMSPGQRFDHPGKSPLMDMALVPVEESGAEAGGVAISPQVVENLGVRVVKVTRGSLAHSISAAATVAYDERRLTLVQARANGFVEHLRVRATLDPVHAGQPLADLYVPDWVAAQEEYLAAKALTSPGVADLLDGARQRLRLTGMPEGLIRSFETTGKVQSRFTVTAPESGVVAELMAREGMTVMNGAPLFRINGLSTVWVNAEIPESLAHLVASGDSIKAQTPAVVGKVFDGKVSAVLPTVSPTTRTLTVRVELDNSNSQLVPGMFVTVEIVPTAQKDVLLVPSEAVIQTGTRSVVMLAEGDGKFRPADVEIGSEAGGLTEIRSGLSAGQEVVVSGQFLIDSEASLKATEARLQ